LRIADCGFLGWTLGALGVSFEKLQSFMLRSKKFRPFEKLLLVGIAFLLIGIGVVGAFLALRYANWRLGVASGGVLVLAMIYLCAARSGKPL
jgi:hypothetical protein